MLHFGKTTSGELEIRATGTDIGVLYRAISSAALIERRELYKMKAMIEEEFKADLQIKQK